MLGVFNVQNDLKSKLSEKFVDIFDFDEKQELPKLNCLFVDWTKDQPVEKYTLQATLMDNYAKKKIPIVIFDRFMKVTKKEFDWLKQFNVYFFEPAVNNRCGFNFLSQWIRKDNLPIKDKETEIDFLYIGNIKDRVGDFEKYYLELSKSDPNLNICYCSSDIPKDKIMKYHYSNVKKVEKSNWKGSSFTIFIDSLENYSIGHVDPKIFKSMEDGCVPIIPVEHRFFGNMFNKFCVENINDLSYMMCFEKFRSVVIESIYDTIIKLYPEFTIDFFYDTIIRYLK